MSFDSNLLHQNPMSASSLYEQAELYRNQGNLEDAIALYQKTIELDPNFSWAYHQLGDIFPSKINGQKPLLFIIKRSPLTLTFPGLIITWEWH